MIFSVFNKIRFWGILGPTGNHASRWIRDLWSKGVSLILAYFETFLSFCVLDDFFRFSKKLGFGVFLVHPPMASVLLSASVEKCFVSRMRDFFKWCHCSLILGIRSLTKSLHDLQKWVFRDVTDKHTDKQTDIVTLWLNRPNENTFPG